MGKHDDITILLLGSPGSRVMLRGGPRQAFLRANSRTKERHVNVASAKVSRSSHYCADEKYERFDRQFSNHP